MIFNDLVTNLCLYMNLKSGCQEAVASLNSQYHISKELDESEMALSKMGEKEAFGLFGKKTIEYSLTAASLTNVILTKSFQIKTNFKPLADEIEINGSKTDWSVNANWKWTWK